MDKEIVVKLHASLMNDYLTSINESTLTTQSFSNLQSINHYFEDIREAPDSHFKKEDSRA